MKNKADEEITNDRSDTSLHCAARNGSANAAKELIEWGANTESDPGMMRMLETALTYGDAELAEVLVDALIVEATSERTTSATRMLNRALYEVAGHGGSRRLMRHLLEAGANIEFINVNGKTPLMAAAKSGHINAVQWLVKNGADCKATDYSDQTALALAERYKRTDVAKFLASNRSAE
jgi:ankyrin repeat protein